MATVTEEPLILAPAVLVEDVDIEAAGDILYEVVDGRIVEKSAGSNEVDLANDLALILNAFVRPNGLGKAVVEMQFVLDEKRKLRRCPDVAFVTADRWPARDSPLRREAYWHLVPDLAVEIVSPGNKTAEDMAKVLEYFHYGVRQVWLVFPEQAQIHVYSSPTDVRIFSKAQGHVLEDGDVIPGLRLPLAEFFVD